MLNQSILFYRGEEELDVTIIKVKDGVIRSIRQHEL
jgi:hypothetical protein